MRFDWISGNEIYLPKLNKFVKFNALWFYETEDKEIIEALSWETPVVETAEKVETPVVEKPLKSNKK